MEDSERAARNALPVILIAAVVQGWSLYALHLAIEHHRWPATEPGWLMALYAISILVPLTVQLLAGYLRERAAIVLIAVLGAALFYMGWHHGNAVLAEKALDYGDRAALLGFAVVVWWLLTLPFLQARLASGAWRPEYRVLFATAWRNKLTLGEAALFTGALWLLLLLWQALFHMLGIDFFRELFRKPVFIYPVTAITFGLALHLIGSVERFTAVVLEQLLNVLKWLAIVAGLILSLFTIALLFKLPGLFSTGERAIGAAWLLWLIAVIVLLINAAYRDGTIERPYPKIIAVALRFVVPFTIVVAVVACYALYVRTEHYGLTVERVWAFIVAGAAAVYACGYTVAALRGGRWMGGIAHVNIIAALLLIVAVAAALTPLLSPYRLAANSQYRRVIEHTAAELDDEDTRRNAFHYLRFDAEGYGRAKLAELANLQDHPRAEDIRKAALAVQKIENRWDAVPSMLQADRLAALTIHPADRTIDDSLNKALVGNASRELSRPVATDELAGVFIDLNGDATEEFVLLVPPAPFIFERATGEWRLAGRLHRQTPFDSRSLSDEFASGEIRADPAAWRDLVIGTRRYRFTQ